MAEIKITGFKLVCLACGSETILQHKKDPSEEIMLIPGYECVVITCMGCKQEIVIGGEPEDDIGLTEELFGQLMENASPVCDLQIKKEGK